MADGGPAAALRALPARTWAVLLRELRSELDAGGAEEPPAGRRELTRLVGGPRSAVAAGAGRDRVADLLAADPELRGRLAGRPALADAVAALDDMPAAPVPAGGRPVVPTSSAGARSGAGDAGLRAELVRTRRQRDGAEARARTAEDRARAAEATASAAGARIAELERALAAAEDERARAAERAARRAEDRLRELGAELVSERSERHRLGGALARAEAAVAGLRLEVERLRAIAPGSGPIVAAPPPRRPVGLPSGVAPDTTEAARHYLGLVDLVVVDGYNLTLRARPGLDLAGQRQWLVGRLRPLVARGLRVVVVFDGAGARGTRRTDAGVDVRFTPERTIADDEIEFIVGEAAAGTGPMLVVTDDAELRRRVAAHEADVVAVLPFVGAVG